MEVQVEQRIAERLYKLGQSKNRLSSVSCEGKEGETSQNKIEFRERIELYLDELDHSVTLPDPEVQESAKCTQRTPGKSVSID